MSTGAIVAIVIIAILVAVLIALYFLGKRLQKRQAEQEEQVQATKQPVTMLVIDKKRMKLTQAGLPQSVIDSTPKLMRRSKVPVVKAKVGPQIMNLVCDDKIFDYVPVKKQVRAMVSGIYIVEVRGVHGQRLENTNPKKSSWLSRTMAKIRKAGGAG